MAKTAGDAAAEVAAYAASFGAFYAFLLIGKRFPACSARSGALGWLFKTCVGPYQEACETVKINMRPAEEERNKLLPVSEDTPPPVMILILITWNSSYQKYLLMKYL